MKTTPFFLLSIKQATVPRSRSAGTCSGGSARSASRRPECRPESDTKTFKNSLDLLGPVGAGEGAERGTGHERGSKIKDQLTMNSGDVAALTSAGWLYLEEIKDQTTNYKSPNYILQRSDYKQQRSDYIPERQRRDLRVHVEQAVAVHVDLIKDQTRRPKIKDQTHEPVAERLLKVDEDAHR
uniref:Uncharacterized protein n=1 Tax=Pristionchus pacificus TaxID=54126 RepID=A0A2A6BXH9_PRIPA|eukprot:PDM70605.1 hypothetical protein PRIPAC_46851 [Pristionchus pacificus]